MASSAALSPGEGGQGCYLPALGGGGDTRVLEALHRYTFEMDAPGGESRGAVLSRDTTAEAERIQVEIWRRMSSLERAQVITGACRAARAFAFAGLRTRHPEASDRKLIALYVELTAGPDLARRAYPGLLEPAVSQQS